MTLAVIVAAEQLQGPIPSITGHLDQVAGLAAFASLIVNYPHFMASYAVAYGRGWRFVSDRWLSLLVAPGVLAVVLVCALATLGSTLRLGAVTVTDLGGHLLGIVTQIMFATVGWHYAKQAYGCARAQAQLRGFRFSSRQARALMVALIPTWLSLWVASNTFVGQLNIYGLDYASVGFPTWTVPATNVALGAGVALATAVLGRAAVANSCRPPLAVCAPIVAMFVWWVPVLANPTFVLLVPFFHSLQYLPFAGSVLRTRHADRRAAGRRTWPGWATVTVLIVAGWATFEGLPGAADRRWPESGGIAAYLLAATLFINVHHYVIDHVAWRLRDPEVRHELFGSVRRSEMAAAAPEVLA